MVFVAAREAFEALSTKLRSAAESITEANPLALDPRLASMTCSGALQAEASSAVVVGLAVTERAALTAAKRDESGDRPTSAAIAIDALTFAVPRRARTSKIEADGKSRVADNAAIAGDEARPAAKPPPCQGMTAAKLLSITLS